MSAVCPPGELGSVGGHQRESWSRVEMMEKSGSNSTRKPPWLGGSSLRDRPLSGFYAPQALSVTPCWRDVGQGQGGTRRDRRADTGEGLGLKGQEGVMAMQVQRVWPGLWQGSGTASRRDSQGGARRRGRSLSWYCKSSNSAERGLLVFGTGQCSHRDNKSQVGAIQLALRDGQAGG